MSILTREQMYAWVWSSPVAKVASELGISGTALAKKCRLNGIPTPGRGYWRQLEQGKNLERPRLPNQEAGMATFLGEVTEERADVLDKLVSATDGSMFEPDATKNTIRPSPVADAKSSEPGFGDVSAAELPNDGPSPEKRSVSQSSRPVRQLKNLLEPSEVLAAAMQAETIESARRFIVALSAAGQECDSSTRAVLALWAESAMGVINQASPIDQVIKDCQEVAAGASYPAWFTSRLKS